MPEEKTQEQYENQHTENYYNQMGLDIKKLLKKKLASYKVATPPIEIPDVEPKGDTVETTPKIKDEKDETIGDTNNLKSDLEDISDDLDVIKIEQKFIDMKQELVDEFTHTIKGLKEELDDFKRREVPQIGSFDSGGIYKEKIFETATRVLDEVLVPIFNDVPDYSLISVQVSRVFDDGTVSDAMIAVSVTVTNEGYRYDFKVDVPVLNGIIYYPQYIQRGLKIIPITYEKVQEELESVSFRKLEPEKPYENKSNIYNNIGDNIYRRPDKQKWYDVENTEPPIVGMPPYNKWNPSREPSVTKPKKEEY